MCRACAFGRQLVNRKRNWASKLTHAISSFSFSHFPSPARRERTMRHIRSGYAKHSTLTLTHCSATRLQCTHRLFHSPWLGNSPLHSVGSCSDRFICWRVALQSRTWARCDCLPFATFAFVSLSFTVASTHTPFVDYSFLCRSAVPLRFAEESSALHRWIRKSMRDRRWLGCAHVDLRLAARSPGMAAFTVCTDLFLSRYKYECFIIAWHQLDSSQQSRRYQNS